MTNRKDRRTLDALARRNGPEALIKAGLAKKANGHRFPVVQLPAPPQDPLQAAIEELVRIQKKAIAGLQAQGVNECPPIPGGWHNYGESKWREPWGRP